MFMRLAALAAFVLLGLSGPSSSQTLQRYTPFGYCSVSSPASATGLSGFTGCSGKNLATVQYAVFCAYTQNAVWRDDGTDPTATPGSGGQVLTAGTCMSYNGTFAAIKFIQQTAGSVVGVSLYR